MDIPLEWVVRCSLESLQEFELSRLNHAANQRKALFALLDEIIDEAAQAKAARWMMEARSGLADIEVLPQKSFDFVTGSGVAVVPKTHTPNSFGIKPTNAVGKLGEGKRMA